MKKKLLIAVSAVAVLLAAALGILYYNGYFDMDLYDYDESLYESEGDWVYSVYDGYAEINSCRRIAGSRLEIPDTLGGYPVKSLGWGFISDDQAKRIKEITVPDTLTYFRKHNFITTAWYKNQPDGIVYLGNIAIDIKGELADGILLIKEGTRVIAGSAFSGEEAITEVILPSTLEVICSDAFTDCDNLEKINIPDSVQEIGSCAFESCKKLKTIETNNTKAFIQGSSLYGTQWLADQKGDQISLCGNLLFYTKEDSAGEDVFIEEGTGRISSFAFELCENMGVIHIPESCTDIDEWAFQDSSFKGFSVDGNNKKYMSDDRGNLFSKDKTKLIRYAALDQSTEFIVPDSVVYIADEAFSNAEYLEKVCIHERVEYIGEDVFFKASALENIEVSEDNSVYKSVDGVLFNKEGTLLISYVNGSGSKSYSIPDGVTNVNDWAFQHCESIEEIVIPDSVERMGSILSCKNLNTSGLVSDREEFISDIYLQNCGFDYTEE